MTTKEANDTRKGLVGKSAFIAWRKYMEKKKNTDLSVENLRAWDEKYNHSSLRESFGSDDDLIEIGVKHKYYAFLNQYTSLKLTAGNTDSGFTLSGIRTLSDGTRAAIDKADPDQIEYMISRLKRDVQGAATRLHAFQYEWDTICNMVSGWLFEMKEEK